MRLKLAIMIATLIIIAKLVSKAAVATVQRRNAYTRLSSANSPSTPSQRVRVCRPTGHGPKHQRDETGDSQHER